MKQKISLTFALLISCALLAAACGGTPAAPAPAQPAAPTVEPTLALPSAAGFVLGYEASDDQNIDGLLKACAETKMECVRGKDIEELVNKKVDAIISYSNQWHVNGAWPQIQLAKQAGIPIFMLNADSGEQDVYNLSTLYRSTRASLEWMMEEMGGEGEFVYFNFGSSGFTQEIIDEVLAAYPKVEATSMPADWGSEVFTQESIIEMVKANPTIKAIWTSDNLMDIYWALKDQKDIEKLPLFRCGTRLDELNAWKDRLEKDASFKCFATIAPGGTDYEGVYAALYHLAGLEFNPQGVVDFRWGKTFLYDYPIITSENLNEWMGKLDSLVVGEYDFYKMPAMTAQEIRAKWFVE